MATPYECTLDTFLTERTSFAENYVSRIHIRVGFVGLCPFLRFSVFEALVCCSQFTKKLAHERRNRLFGVLRWIFIAHASNWSSKH